MSRDLTSHHARWIGPIVTVGLIVLVIGILLPALQRAREAARRTESKNNLKQIGLALHNYHDAFRMFPPGGVFNEDGTAFHGWLTMMTPFIDASPFYNQTNFNIPWDDPLQIDHFMKSRYDCFRNPSQEPTHSIDGLPLMHYSANQWLMNRNSSVAIKDIKTGTSNTLMAGNAFGDFPPFGYPFNWRDPLLPINSTSEGFGFAPDGMLVLLADGGVRWINNDLAAEVHAAFAGPEDLRPSAEQVAKPDHPYRIAERKIWTTVEIYSNAADGWTLLGRKNPEGTLVEASFTSSRKKSWSREEQPLDEAMNHLRSFDSLEAFYGSEAISDAGLKILANLPRISVIDVGGNWITDEGVEIISQMPNLKSLAICNTRVTDEGIRKLSKLPLLKTLELSTNAVGDAGFTAIAAMTTLETLKLGEVDMRGKRLEILSHLPQLRALTLTDVDVTDQDWECFEPQCRLQKLKFSCSSKGPRPSDVTLSRLKDHCPQLQIVIEEHR